MKYLLNEQPHPEIRRKAFIAIAVIVIPQVWVANPPIFHLAQYRLEDMIFEDIKV